MSDLKFFFAFIATCEGLCAPFVSPSGPLNKLVFPLNLSIENLKLSFEVCNV